VHLRSPIILFEVFDYAGRCLHKRRATWQLRLGPGVTPPAASTPRTRGDGFCVLASGYALAFIGDATSLVQALASPLLISSASLQL
jgi:hypothetical protein